MVLYLLDLKPYDDIKGEKKKRKEEKEKTSGKSVCAHKTDPAIAAVGQRWGKGTMLHAPCTPSIGGKQYKDYCPRFPVPGAITWSLQSSVFTLVYLSR